MAEPMFARRDVATTSMVRAPDGSAVRPLVRTARASLAHFDFPAGQVSFAVRHRTVDELWFVVEGYGRLWRRRGDAREMAGESVEEIVELGPGVAVDIPVGTSFQLMIAADAPLLVVGSTTPPWTDDHEAEVVNGPWTPTVGGPEPS